MSPRTPQTGNMGPPEAGGGVTRLFGRVFNLERSRGTRRRVVDTLVVRGADEGPGRRGTRVDWPCGGGTACVSVNVCALRRGTFFRSAIWDRKLGLG